MAHNCLEVFFPELGGRLRKRELVNVSGSVSEWESACWCLLWVKERESVCECECERVRVSASIEKVSECNRRSTQFLESHPRQNPTHSIHFQASKHFQRRCNCWREKVSVCVWLCASAFVCARSCVCVCVWMCEVRVCVCECEVKSERSKIAILLHGALYQVPNPVGAQKHFFIFPSQKQKKKKKGEV